MSQKLEGKIAVVTGGNSGIGLATAKLFALEGAQVIITGRRSVELDEAVRKIGGKATAVQGDVSNLADLDHLYDQVKQKHGHIDILFANAGFGEFVPFGQITEAHFDKTFDINVKGLLFTVQKALPQFRDGGSIILNASIASIKGIEAFSVYSASKAAVRSFARSWTSDLRARKIRVNAISPGVVITPAYKNALKMSDEQINEYAANAAITTPLGRPGTPDEIARVALFLASEDSGYVTGIELFVDGGLAQI